MSAEDRREAILTAARGVFVAHGTHGARTRDIAKAAGINEAMLYRHFASKEELFQAAVIEPLEQTVTRLADIAAEPPQDPARAREEMLARSQHYVRDLVGVLQEIAPLLGAVVFDGEEKAGQHYDQTIRPVLTQVADMIRANLQWWEHGEFDPDLMVRFMFGAVWFEVTTARLEGREIDADWIAGELGRSLILGIARRD